MSKKVDSDGGSNTHGEDGEMNQQNKFLFEALKSELEKMMTQRIEEVHERITRENEERLHRNRDERRRQDPIIFQRGGGRRGGRGGRGGGNFRHDDRYSEADFEDEEDARSEFDERQPRGRDRVDNNLGNIKINIPSFQGKNDPELYLEWERKVENVFDCHNYSELKKVKLAAIEFSDYALVIRT